jgi:hypothetical protein
MIEDRKCENCKWYVLRTEFSPPIPICTNPEATDMSPRYERNVYNTDNVNCGKEGKLYERKKA